MAIALLTHDHPVARGLGGRAIVLDRGRMTRRGTVTDIVSAAARVAA
jgi:peptide/nickel transport system ATP-binding protein